MKLFYVTLNNEEDAQRVSQDLLEQRYAVCTNWFPITCAYRWEDQVKSGKEIVLLIKTQNNYRSEIEKTIANHINYTNFIAELDVHSVNTAFNAWLQVEVVAK